MGQEPYYSFNFVVAERQSPTFAFVPPRSFREMPDIGAAAGWLWRRILGEAEPPPR